MSDLIQSTPDDMLPGAIAEKLTPGIRRLDEAAEDLLKAEARQASSTLSSGLLQAGVAPDLVRRLARLYEMDGAVGIAALAARLGIGEVEATAAYTRLGEALGLDWAKAAALRLSSADPWERLLVAGLLQEFEQLRLAFLDQHGAGDPVAAVEAWLEAQRPRVAQFTELVARARANAQPSAAMLAQIAAQARLLLAR